MGKSKDALINILSGFFGFFLACIDRIQPKTETWLANTFKIFVMLLPDRISMLTTKILVSSRLSDHRWPPYSLSDTLSDSLSDFRFSFSFMISKFSLNRLPKRLLNFSLRDSMFICRRVTDLKFAAQQCFSSNIQRMILLVSP